MNEKTKEKVFVIGAILVLMAVILYFFKYLYAPYGFAVGVAMIAVVRLSSPYKGKNVRVKRLKRMQLFSAILMIVASSFMFNQKNEWVIFLLCAAVFEVYSAFVLPNEKENK